MAAHTQSTTDTYTEYPSDDPIVESSQRLAISFSCKENELHQSGDMATPHTCAPRQSWSEDMQFCLEMRLPGTTVEGRMYLQPHPGSALPQLLLL